MAATSVFAYPVTRRFPSHFTWIILAGGAILVTFFTFVAVAGNGYQLQSIYTTDPNTTESSLKWFQKRPFAWANELETACQASLLVIGGDYMTTNQGFRYTIERFRYAEKEDSDAVSTEVNANVDSTTSGVANNIPLTAAYKNSTIRDCHVRTIVIDLLRSDESRLPRNFWAWAATEARSTVECTMDTVLGPLMVNFTSRLPPISRRNEITNTFLASNDSNHPGRWLGAQITQSWYLKLSESMGWSVPVKGDKNIEESTASWGSGTITLTRNESVTDYESVMFFKIGFSISDNQGWLAFIPSPDTMQDWRDEWNPDTTKTYGLPNISAVVDVFGKSYYSLLLSDFNPTEANQETNALATTQGLQYLQSVNNSFLAVDAYKLSLDGKPRPNLGTIPTYFDPQTENLTQPLRTPKYTTLLSQYLCSVPKEKSIFNLLFAVVLADIVFISSCWTLFCWVATWWLGRKDDTTEHCAGCAGKKDTLSTELLEPSKGATYTRVSSESRERDGSQSGSGFVLSTFGRRHNESYVGGGRV